MTDSTTVAFADTDSTTVELGGDAVTVVVFEDGDATAVTFGVDATTIVESIDSTTLVGVAEVGPPGADGTIPGVEVDPPPTAGAYDATRVLWVSPQSDWEAGGQNNVAIGGAALATDPGGGYSSGNVAIGVEALRRAVTQYCTALGAFAGHSITSGANNTLLGAWTGAGITTGQGNTGIGGALGSVSTGSGNTGIGVGAGPQSDLSNTTCVGRNASATAPGGIAIGTDSAGMGATASATDEIAIGTGLHTTRVPGALAVAGKLTAPDGVDPDDVATVGQLAAQVPPPAFRHIGPDEPDTSTWAVNDFWYDTSTET